MKVIMAAIFPQEQKMLKKSGSIHAAYHLHVNSCPPHLFVTS